MANYKRKRPRADSRKKCACCRTQRGQNGKRRYKVNKPEHYGNPTQETE